MNKCVHKNSTFILLTIIEMAERTSIDEFNHQLMVLLKSFTEWKKLPKWDYSYVAVQTFMDIVKWILSMK